MTRRADGTTLLRSAQPLGPYDRAGDGWRAVTYGDAFEGVRRIGESLLARGLTTATPGSSKL